MDPDGTDQTALIVRTRKAPLYSACSGSPAVVLKQDPLQQADSRVDREKELEAGPGLGS